MKTQLLIGMGFALALAGCVTTPQPNAALESARTIVQAAVADPNAAKYAALDVQAAQADLAAADAAYLKHDEAGIAQPAYMAAQSARLAQLRGAAKADDARVAAGQAERDSILLAARSSQVDSAKRATDAATSNSARLQAEVDALKAKPTDRGLVLTLGDVLFETGSATLSPGAGRNLDRLVQFLTEHPDRLVQIDGFTDSIGTDSFNQDLSQRRADAVRSSLQSRGIASARIATQGYGKEYPVASNSESSGRQLNRRVEVVIGADGGAAVAARRS
jgi:outer membrane protein OmpA-like peptidoglycan-associated protein